jgi:hypothetical protein
MNIIKLFPYSGQRNCGGISTASMCETACRMDEFECSN